MKESFDKVLEKECNGCAIDHPSQKQHSCLGDSSDSVDRLFEILLKEMNWKVLNRECCDALNKPFDENNFIEYDYLHTDEEWKIIRRIS